MTVKPSLRELCVYKLLIAYDSSELEGLVKRAEKLAKQAGQRQINTLVEALNVLTDKHLPPEAKTQYSILTFAQILSNSPLLEEGKFLCLAKVLHSVTHCSDLLKEGKTTCSNKGLYFERMVKSQEVSTLKYLLDSPSVSKIEKIQFWKHLFHFLAKEKLDHFSNEFRTFLAEGILFLCKDSDIFAANACFFLRLQKMGVYPELNKEDRDFFFERTVVDQRVPVLKYLFLEGPSISKIEKIQFWECLFRFIAEEELYICSDEFRTFLAGGILFLCENPEIFAANTCFSLCLQKIGLYPELNKADNEEIVFESTQNGEIIGMKAAYFLIHSDVFRDRRSWEDYHEVDISPSALGALKEFIESGKIAELEEPVIYELIDFSHAWNLKNFNLYCQHGLFDWFEVPEEQLSETLQRAKLNGAHFYRLLHLNKKFDSSFVHPEYRENKTPVEVIDFDHPEKLDISLDRFFDLETLQDDPTTAQEINWILENFGDFSLKLSVDNDYKILKSLVQLKNLGLSKFSQRKVLTLLIQRVVEHEKEVIIKLEDLDPSIEMLSFFADEVITREEIRSDFLQCLSKHHPNAKAKKEKLEKKMGENRAIKLSKQEKKSWEGMARSYIPPDIVHLGTEKTKIIILLKLLKDAKKTVLNNWQNLLKSEKKIQFQSLGNLFRNDFSPNTSKGDLTFLVKELADEIEPRIYAFRKNFARRAKEKIEQIPLGILWALGETQISCSAQEKEQLFTRVVSRIEEKISSKKKNKEDELEASKKERSLVVQQNLRLKREFLAKKKVLLTKRIAFLAELEKFQI